MTAIDNTPINKNFLSPLNFRFQIKKAPNVNFFIQKVNIPDITLSSPETTNPFVNTPIPGEHLSYGSLEVSFAVDEDLTNYLEIHNWLVALGKPENFQQYADIQNKPSYTGDGIYSDITVLVMSSVKQPNFDITYTDAFPVSLSSLVFNTIDENVNYITASATFKYTYYNITKI
jgi:hypothetical protein